MRKAIFFARQANKVEHLRHLLTDDMLRLADDLQRKSNVLKHGLIWQKLVVLKDVAHGATQMRDLAVCHLIDVAPGHPDIASLGAFLTIHQAQEG